MLKKFIGLIIIILLFAIGANAQLHRPSPGTGKEIKPPPQQSPTQQQKPEPDKRGTEQVPFVVKTIPASKSQTETEQERKEHQDKSSQGWWAIWLTAFVATATFLQAIFLYFSLRETRKAANAAESAAKIAKDQSIDMKTSLAIAEKAADAAKGSVDAFQAIERAKLFVRVERDPPPKQGELIENIKEGNNRVRIIIINEGKSVAILTKINWHVGVMDDREIDDKISKLGSNPASEFPYGVITIRRDGTKKIPVDCNITKSDLHKIDESTAYYVCLGQIKYKDVFRKVRPIVFCWKDDGTFFGPDPDPTRNYGT